MSNINSYSYYGKMELDNMITDFEENIKLTETRDLIDLMDYLKFLLDKEKNETLNNEIIDKEDYIYNTYDEQNDNSSIKQNIIKEDVNIREKKVEEKTYTKEQVRRKKQKLKRFCDRYYDIYIRDENNEPGYVKMLNLRTSSDEEIMKANILTGFF
tara:strand:+ start:1212 stop:1679 length:468 start_codon:yes stop_codon:yes gene_type:complete